MARSTIAFSLLLLACLVLFEQGFAYHVKIVAPGYDPSSLHPCLKNITEFCGIEIFQNIVHRGPPITKACCGALLKFGHPCHSELILTVISTGKFASQEAKILKKSTAAWKRCLSIAQGQ